MRAGPNRPFAWLIVPLAVCLAAPSPAARIAVVGIAMLIVLAQTATLVLAERRAIRRAAAAAVHLGEDTAGGPVLLSDDHLAAHVLILGASGAGKTTTLTTILEAQIARGRPVIAVDLKGSPAFARTLASACLSAGRTFRLWTPDGPSHWNPLEHGSATELKDRLMGSERFTEPHYERAAERYLQTALQLLLCARPGQRPHLAEVVAALETRRGLGAVARGMSGALADRAREHLSALTPDQLSAVRGLATRLAVLSESDTGAWLAPGAGPSVNLRRALAGREVVLFSINSSAYGSLAAQLGSLAIQDLAGAIGHRLAGGGGPPALVALDEFSALRSANVLALLARGREAGVSVVLATQELADLDRAARGFREQVLGNTALKLVHRQDVPDSARAAAAMAGSELVWEQRTRPARPALGAIATMLGAERPARPLAHRVERDRVRPDEVARLATGRALLIAKAPRAEVRIVRVRPAPERRRAQARGPSRSQPPPGVTR